MTNAPGITHDHILGCLAGGAVADAVGFEVEFKTVQTILAERGPGGARGPSVPGFVAASDDTQMTLFTAEGLTRALATGPFAPGAALAAINEAYLDWFGTQGRAARPPVGDLARDPALHKIQAPGSTCLTALGRGGNGSVERPINDSKGCGGVMRVAPVGLLPMATLEQAFELGARTAALTHGHPEGYWSTGALAAIIHQAVRGGDLAGGARVAARLAAARPGGDAVAALIDDALLAAQGPRLTPDALVDRLGAGWTGESALAVGLYAALAGDGFVDAVALGATHSGDSDSTASVAGQLLGARDGLAVVPADWWADLDLRAAVERVAAAFCAATGIPLPVSGPTAPAAPATRRLFSWLRR